MSTHWDIYCRTCTKGCGFHTGYKENLKPLLSKQKHWSELADIDLSEMDFSLWGDDDGGLRRWPEFAKQHLGHDISIRNEYGGFDDQCSETMNCSTCDGWAFCGLPRNHEGPHEAGNRKGRKATS